MNKLGTFRITQDTLVRIGEEETALILSLLMAQVVIVRAESDYASRTIEYTAYSNGFDDVPIGQKPPVYQWVVTKTPRPGEDVGIYDYTVKPQRCEHELITYKVEDIRI